MYAVRVLIADHDESLLANYASCIQETSWEITVVTTGLQCVEQLRSLSPDLLVLEPELLWGGGAGVLAQMAGVSDVPRVPVMILTAGRDQDELARALQYPIDDFQLKPLSADALARRIRWVLDTTSATSFGSRG